MKTKCYVVLLMLLLALNGAWAQTSNSIAWGAANAITMRTAFFRLDILGADKTGVYAVQIPYEAVINGMVVGGVNGYKLARYSAGSMNTPELLSLDLKDEDAERAFEFARKIGNDYVIFSSFQNRKLQKTFLFAQTLNTATFTLNKDLKKVAEVSFAQADKYKAHEFDHQWSPDNSKLLVHYKLKDKDGSVLVSGFNVLDNKLNLLWSGKDELALNSGEIFTFKQLQVDNKGNVYLLGTVFQDKGDFKASNKFKSKGMLASKSTLRREPNYVHLLVKYAKGAPASQYRIEDQQGFVTDLQISVAANQDIVLAGFYAMPNTVSVVGACNFTIANNSKAVTARNFQPFADDFMVPGMNESEGSGKKSNAKQKDMDECRYYFQNMQLHTDGSYTLIAEQYRVDWTTSTNAAIMAGAEYHDENIILVHFSKSGKMLWNQKILKHQWTNPLNRPYASYDYHYHNKAMYFVFNEIPKAFNYNKSKAMMVRVNAVDGKMDKQELFDATKKNVVLVSATSQPVDPGTVLLYAQKKFMYQFFQLKL